MIPSNTFDTPGGCAEEKRLFTELYPMRKDIPQELELTGTVDTVYHAYRHLQTFFIKGEHVWVNHCLYSPGRHNCLSYAGKWFDIWFDICDVE